MTSALPAGAADARAAGLRYSSDDGARDLAPPYGQRLQLSHRPRGARASERTLARIRALAIPPAWRDVWICPDARGHLQATGRDARGRKQYLYHPEWRTQRDATKFDRMVAFGATLPRAARPHRRRPRLAGLPRERVLAAVARLVDDTLIRVGNEQYRRANGSFGATTIRQSHARGRRAPASRRVHGQGRQAVACRGHRPAARTHAAAPARPAGARAVRVPRQRRQAAARALRGRQRLPAGRERGGPDRQGLPHLGRERPVHASARRDRCAGLGGEGRPLDRRGDSRGRGRARQHPRRVPCVVRPSRAAGVRTRRATCRRRPAAGCGAWIAGNPRCCASCGRS